MAVSSPSMEKYRKNVGVNVYFAKPCANYQRGTNENTNGIIRRHWPKKMAMGALTQQDIRQGLRTSNKAQPGGRSTGLLVQPELLLGT